MNKIKFFYAIWRQNRVVIDGLHYVLNDDHAVLVGRDDDYRVAAPVIPDTVKGLPVTEIGEKAFYPIGSTWNNWLKIVTIPEGVTRIGEDAFANCTGITTLNLPNSMKYIGPWGFSNCINIKELVLPPNLEETGMSAFARAGKNKTFIVPKSLKKMGDYTFSRNENAEEYIVEEGNPSYVSHDGIIFSKDMKTLYVYPMANPRTTYTVPASVELLYCVSFAVPSLYNDVPLKTLYLPSYTIDAMGYTFDDQGAGNRTPLTIYGRQGTALWVRVINEQIAFGKINLINTAVNEPPKFVESVEISGANSVPVSGRLKLLAKTAPEGTIDSGVLWSSSDTSVATVDGDGNVTGVGVGAVTITATARDSGNVATDNPIFDEITVNVFESSSTVDLDNAAVDYAMDVISSTDFTFKQEDGNTTSEISALVDEKIKALPLYNVNYSFTVEDLVQAVEGELATPKGVDGSFSIWVQLSQNSVSKSKKLIDKVITASPYIANPEIILTPSKTTVERGEKVTLTATTNDIYMPKFTWYQGGFLPGGYEIGTTGDINTMVVDTSKMIGKQVFGVEVNGKQSELVTINVKEPFVSATGLTNLPNKLIKGESLKLSGGALPDNATNKDIFWEISENNELYGVSLTNDVLYAENTGTIKMKATIINGAIDDEGKKINYSEEFEIQVLDKYVPVTSIENVPEKITANDWFELPQTVTPSNADQKEIIWRAASDDEGQKYGTEVVGGKVYSKSQSVGTADINKAHIVATVINGLYPGIDYVCDFYIFVGPEYNKVDRVTNLPNRAVVGKPLLLSGSVTPKESLDIYDNRVTKSVVYAISPQNVLSGLSIRDGYLYAEKPGRGKLEVIVSNGTARGEDYIQEFDVDVFMEVEDIANVQSFIVAGIETEIMAEVLPHEANNQSILWSVSENNTGGSVSIADGKIICEKSGTITALATIEKGLDNGDYTKRFTINVKPNINISEQSKTVRAIHGSDATLFVVAEGTPEISYQWQQRVGDSFEKIDGETKSSLLIPKVDETCNNRIYRCVISNSTGFVISEDITLIVEEYPIIVNQPKSLRLVIGEDGMFIVEATGNPTPTYQWQKKVNGNWENIDGEAKSEFKIEKASIEDDGMLFRCVVSNSTGETISDEVTLNTGVMPSIISSPENKTVIYGENVELAVTADGYPEPKYQWQKLVGDRWEDIEGKNESTILLNQEEYINNMTLRCVAENSFGEALSEAATLNVIKKPEILIQPESGFAEEGGFLTFSISVLENGTLWYSCEKLIDGKWSTFDDANNEYWQNGYNANMLGIYGATSKINGSTYRFVIGNEAGETISNEFTLTVVEKFIGVDSMEIEKSSIKSGERLSATVLPTNAAKKNILWSIDSANTLMDAKIIDGRLISKTGGMVRVRATIINGFKNELGFIENISEAFDIFVLPSPIAEYTVGGKKIQSISELSGGETVFADASVYNDTKTGENVQFVFGIYRNDRLIDLYLSDKELILPSSIGGISDLSFSLPNDLEGVHISCFVFDDIQSLVPLLQKDEF